MALDIFDLMQTTNNYELTFYEEPSVHLRSIIAINNTVLGPVLATTKIFDFGNVEKATQVALRMAYYNTYRSALLRRPFGGGSIVLCGDPRKVKNEFYLRALGIYINKFAGNLYIAQSADLTDEDIKYIMRETNYVLGGNEDYIINGMSPSKATALGIINGIRASVKYKFGRDEISGLTFVVEGIDGVGYYIVEQLLQVEDVKVIITDRVYDRIKAIQDRVPEVKVVRPNEIYKQVCDVFISCTFDSNISEQAVNQLQTKILTGSVNNVIYSDDVEKILKERGILYIPGYVINGGEIIWFDNEFSKQGIDILENQLLDIYTLTIELLRMAHQQKKTINEVAISTAAQYIENIAAIKKLR